MYYQRKKSLAGLGAAPVPAWSQSPFKNPPALDANWGALANVHNNGIAVDLYNQLNDGGVFISPSIDNPGTYTIFPQNGQTTGLTDSVWVTGVNTSATKPGVIYSATLHFQDPGSRGTVNLPVLYTSSPYNPGAGGAIVAYSVPGWTGGAPGGVIGQFLSDPLAGLTLAAFAGGIAYGLSAGASIGGAASSGASSAASSGASTVANYSLAVGMPSGIGVAVPGAIAAPVTGLADVAGGSGLVAAGTALPTIGAGTAGLGVTVPANIAAPVSSLADVAGGQGLVAASQGGSLPANLDPFKGIRISPGETVNPGVSPAVSSPIPSKVPSLPSVPNIPPQLQNTLINKAVGAGIVALTGGAASGGAGGMLYPTSTGAGSVSPNQPVSSLSGGLQATLARAGAGGLLLGGLALFFLLKGKR
jgi:hypothetical protein